MRGRPQPATNSSPTSRKSFNWIAASTAIGTILAGIAAVAALFINRNDGDESSRNAATVGEEANAAGTTPSAGMPSQLTIARSFSDLGSQVTSLAAERLDDDPADFDDGFERIEADSGDVSIELPVAWTDVETTNWLNDAGKVVGAAIVSAPDIDGLYSGYVTPGAFVGASPAAVSPESLLATREATRSSNCTDEGGSTLDGDGYEGVYHEWSGCGGEDTVVVDLAANPRKGPGTLLFHFRMTDQRDIEACQHALDSMDVDIQSVTAELGHLSPGFLID